MTPGCRVGPRSATHLRNLGSVGRAARTNPAKTGSVGGGRGPVDWRRRGPRSSFGLRFDRGGRLLEEGADAAELLVAVVEELVPGDLGDLAERAGEETLQGDGGPSGVSVSAAGRL